MRWCISGFLLKLRQTAVLSHDPDNQDIVASRISQALAMLYPWIPAHPSLILRYRSDQVLTASPLHCRYSYILDAVKSQPVVAIVACFELHLVLRRVYRWLGKSLHRKSGHMETMTPAMY